MAPCLAAKISQPVGGGPCLGRQAVDRAVVVGRIVVEQGQSLRTREVRERGGLEHAGMPPAEMFGIFLRGILGVVDEQVDTFGDDGAGGP